VFSQDSDAAPFMRSRTANAGRNLAEPPARTDEHNDN